MKKLLTTILCVTLVTTGCASSRGALPITQTPESRAATRTVIAEYAQKVPAGSKIRVDQYDGQSFRATLMKTTDRSIVVQQATRVPEPPIEIPFDDILRVTPDTNGSTGRNIGIGVATGIAATFGVLLLLAALLSD